LQLKKQNLKKRKNGVKKFACIEIRFDYLTLLIKKMISEILFNLEVLICQHNFNARF